MPDRSVLATLLETRLDHAPGEIALAVREVLGAAGLEDASIAIADYSQHVLSPLEPAGGPRLDINGTAAGRAFRLLAPVVTGTPGRRSVFTPLLDGGSRLGVLFFTVDEVDDDLLALAGQIGGLVALMLSSSRHYSDLLDRARRTAPLKMESEMRWETLPSLSLIAPPVSFAGMLEPAYEVAGDSFDAAVDDDRAHFAIFDAIGHGMEASRIATLTLGAYRHLRREGHGLAATYRRIDEVLADQFDQEKFVTGHLVELDVATGELAWVAAGHPAPMLVRGGRTHDLEVATALPMGTGLTGDPTVTTYGLEPGDLVLFFSDGVTEARSGDGTDFGRDTLSDLVVRATQSGEPLPEMARRLVHAVIDHVGSPLRDDATVLLVNWHP